MATELVVGFTRETVVDGQERDSGLKWHRVAVGMGRLRWSLGVGGMLDLMTSPKSTQVFWRGACPDHRG